MVGGEIHRESIALAAGDLLRIVAGQEELDLRLTLRDAEGRVLRSADAPTGQMEPETLSWIAPAAGTYQIEVSSFSEVSTPRAYRITVEPLRPAGPEDREEVAEEESVAAVDAQLNRPRGLPCGAGARPAARPAAPGGGAPLPHRAGAPGAQ